jgi:hypothetical protein
MIILQYYKPKAIMATANTTRKPTVFQEKQNFWDAYRKSKQRIMSQPNPQNIGHRIGNFSLVYGFHHRVFLFIKEKFENDINNGFRIKIKKI